VTSAAVAMDPNATPLPPLFSPLFDGVDWNRATPLPLLSPLPQLHLLCATPFALTPDGASPVPGDPFGTLFPVAIAAADADGAAAAVADAPAVPQAHPGDASVAVVTSAADAAAPPPLVAAEEDSRPVPRRRAVSGSAAATAAAAASGGVVPRAMRRAFAPRDEWMRRAVHIDSPTGRWPVRGRTDPICARVLRLVAHDRHLVRDPVTGAPLAQQPHCGLAWVRSASGAVPYCTNTPDTKKSVEGLCRECGRGLAALLRHVRAIACDPRTGVFAYDRGTMQRVYDYVYAAAGTWTFARRAYQYSTAAGVAAEAPLGNDPSFMGAVARAPAGVLVDAPASLDTLADENIAHAPSGWLPARACVPRP